ncbi:hypothetical protein PLICRDRAFT_111412, partial [Plicaturopsis crispa FD-325 SS-3]
VMDGRYHTACGHFVSMASRIQDCLRPNCLFSRRHEHVACKDPACIRLMNPPVRNPIRISPTKCGECVVRDRHGTLGFDPAFH